MAALAGRPLEPARVSADYGKGVVVDSARGAEKARLTGALRRAGRPIAVGDWVALTRTAGVVQIRDILPRRTAIRRKVPDAQVGDQILAANVDVAFIACAPGTDFNLRRIERLLTVAYQGGAVPMILLTKADLADGAAYGERLAEIAPGVPSLAVSALRGEGLDEFRAQIQFGKTGVLLGSSGVGKSTLINRLVGDEVLRTQAVHRTGQGRHTTSHRQLLQVPGGGLIIDTPGLREIQLWAGEDALTEVFARSFVSLQRLPASR